MLLANRKVAEHIGKKKGKEDPKTFVYRIHDVPNPDKLQTFAEFVSKLGYKIQTGSARSISRSLNDLFKQIQGKGEENMIEAIAVRTMAKAEYSTDNIGHYGLAFPYYTHFTSPIRRYPDLMVHRLLDHYLHGGSAANKLEYEEKCKHSSEMERKALEAEHQGNTLRVAQQLEELTGLESRMTILGHLQRGGTPSAADRLLATRLGTACSSFINDGVYGVMVAARGDRAEPVPLEQVAGKLKTVPLDHPWIASARAVGTNLGD